MPIGKQVTYFYRPHREGTYMYHCHWEDVEHVQMGMTGIVFVTPKQDGTSLGGFTKFAYNDGDGSTGYNRHFAILLNEIWKKGYHDGDRDIQESVATDYDPEWFTLNGRSYPDTIAPNDDSFTTSGITTNNPNYGTDDKSQPNSSLIQVNGGDRVLLRLANLGYQQHAMELPGLQLHVVGAGCLATPRRHRRHLVLDEHPLSRARRGTRRAVRRTGVRREQAVRLGRTTGWRLQRLLLQEPRLAEALEQRRLRSRRNDDRGAGVPDRAANPDRRGPELCLSRETPAEGSPR